MSSPVRALSTGSRQEAPKKVGSTSVRRRWILLIIPLSAVLFLGMFVASQEWPFSEESIVKRLAEASDSAVSVRTFRRTYFPFPGCILDGLEFRRGSRNQTFITIERLSIEGNYFQLIHHRVPRIVANNAHVFISPIGTGEPFHTEDSSTAVEKLLVRDSVVDFLASDPQKAPLRFLVHEASFQDLKFGNPFAYSIKVRNPNPPGEIVADGRIGDLKRQETGDTPVSGQYTFEDADLSVYHGIAGMLRSKGKFNGTLSHINVAGTTDVRNFEVDSSGHSVRLDTNFEIYVDATRGDTFLKHVEARWGRTLIEAHGSVASIKGHKVGRFDLAARQGRVEDVLGLFVKKERSPMAGATVLQAHAELPPGPEPFLERVTLSGSFAIENGSFTKPTTQNDVDQLSAGARGQNKDDPERVLSKLMGEVKLQGGTAKFASIRFDVPGAAADLHGNYSVVTHRVNLHGQMKVNTKISKTTSGVKSFLLRVIDPLFKKRKKGEIVPVHILGTYEHPEFGLDLKKPDNQAER